jgi:hypothetical protein
MINTYSLNPGTHIHDWYIVLIGPTWLGSEMAPIELRQSAHLLMVSLQGLVSQHTSVPGFAGAGLEGTVAGEGGGAAPGGGGGPGVPISVLAASRPTNFVACTLDAVI